MELPRCYNTSGKRSQEVNALTHRSNLRRQPGPRISLFWPTLRNLEKAFGGPGEIRTHDLFHAMEAQANDIRRPQRATHCKHTVSMSRDVAGKRLLAAGK